MRATRNSWKNNPMPLEKEKLSFEATYTGENIDKIKYGYIPEEMEDKWFIYFHDNCLYVHRSWTGYCMFLVTFKDSQSKLEVKEAWVNRDISQYKNLDIEYDIDLLKALIDNKILGSNRGN